MLSIVRARKGRRRLIASAGFSSGSKRLEFEPQECLSAAPVRRTASIHPVNPNAVTMCTMIKRSSSERNGQQCKQHSTVRETALNHPVNPKDRNSVVTMTMLALSTCVARSYIT